MPPTRSKPLRDADVWLDESLWDDEPRPRRRRAEQDIQLSTRTDGSDLFDHERVDQEHERNDRDEIAAGDVVDEPQGTPPGLFRRPLVEVQRSVPTVGPRRSLASAPDRIALWAVALAVLTLVSAIISSHGG